MVTAASDKRMRRRGGRRQQAGSTPAAVGTALREAARRRRADLAEIQDRTGVPCPNSRRSRPANLSLFPDQRSALTAVRRYGDLVQLDVERLRSAWWRSTGGLPWPGSRAAAGGHRRGQRGRTQSVHLTGAVPTGHLSRYPGDGTHLRAFTQTDEVPGVRRTPAPAGNGHNVHGAFTDTGSFPAVPAVYSRVRAGTRCSCGPPSGSPPRSWSWPSAAWRSSTTSPSCWQTSISCTTRTPRPPRLRAPREPGRTPAHPERPRPTRRPVRLTDTGAGSATVSVQASNYSVVVAAWAPCWIDGAHPAELLAGLRGHAPGRPGQGVRPGRRPAHAEHERLTRHRAGADQREDGAGWLFKPTSVPFTLNFDSTTSS